MAANRIKGITIEIGGDTTKLQTALKGVNTEVRNTQQQLKDVEKLLKLDPGNTELLAQKHKLLGEAVAATKEKLEEQAKQSGTALQEIAAKGEKLKTVGDNISNVGQKFLPVTAGVVGLGTAAVKTAADFDSAMSKVAAASSNANTNVSMMSETFKYAAPIAGALGFSVEDTAEAIGLMANAGIKGSQAGTSLRTIMTNLSGDVKICGANIGEVTVATTNADGSMRDLSDILADCRVAFAGLSESEQAAAAESLVGKNAMSGFLALMNAGEGDINKLSSAIANCDGTAANMADTMNNNLEGQLTILKSQLQELAISFGEMLMPAIRTIVGWIQGFVDKLNSMDEGTRKVIITIALVAAAIGPVLIIVGKVISAIGTIMTIVPKLAGVINAAKGVFAAFNAVCAANPYVLIIAAIVALVAAFIYLWNNCEEFRQFWIDLWEGIKEIAIAVWEALKEFFKAAWEAIKSTAETVWNAIKNFFQGLWDGIKAIFQIVVDAIKLIITTYFNIYKTIITTVLNAIKTVFTTIWNAIKTVVTTVVTAISTFLTTAWNAIQTTATTIWNAISGFFTNIWNGIKNVITTAINAIKNVVTTAWNNIKNTVTSVGNAIKNAVSTVWNNVTSAVKNAMSNVFNAVKSGFSNVKEHITGLASQAFNWGKDLIMGIVNGIKSCISAVGDAVSSVADKIKSFLHFSVPDEGPLTDYESWMPDFMKGLAKGIENSKGMVTKAMDSLSADMAINPQVNGMQAAMAGGGTVSSADLSGLVSAIRDAVGGVNASGQGGDIVIPVYLGGTMLDEVIVNAQQRANLRSGGR